VFSCFSCVLLNLDSLDADRCLLALGVEVFQGALLHHWVVLLSDLVALRQVCVHVVLPVKLHLPRDLAIQRYSTLQSLLKTFFVQHGQSAWKSTVQVS
jgi:hypothetical protein